jgi:hypothetical protein
MTWFGHWQAVLEWSFTETLQLKDYPNQSSDIRHVKSWLQQVASWWIPHRNASWPIPQASAVSPVHYINLWTLSNVMHDGGILQAERKKERRSNYLLGYFWTQGAPMLLHLKEKAEGS